MNNLRYDFVPLRRIESEFDNSFMLNQETMFMRDNHLGQIEFQSFISLGFKGKNKNIIIDRKKDYIR